MSKEWNHDLCPVCKERFVTQCRCMLSDRTCPNKHKWHKCKAHGSVLGGGHGVTATEDGCTCEPQPQKKLLNSPIYKTEDSTKIRTARKKEDAIRLKNALKARGVLRVSVSHGRSAWEQVQDEVMVWVPKESMNLAESVAATLGIRVRVNDIDF